MWMFKVQLLPSSSSSSSSFCFFVIKRLFQSLFRKGNAFIEWDKLSRNEFLMMSCKIEKKKAQTYTKKEKTIDTDLICRFKKSLLVFLISFWGGGKEGKEKTKWIVKSKTSSPFV